MKIFRVTVSRPAKQSQEDPWKLRRSVTVVGESFDAATKKAIAHYNDLDDVDDYFVSEVYIVASDVEGEGDVLIMA